MRDRRVDAPHSVGREGPQDTPPGAIRVEEPPEPPPQTPGESEVLAGRLRLQASQLAEHLRLQQRELDRREAELNARAARLDNAERSARLWLGQREDEIRDRRAALDQREIELATRLDRLAAAEQASERRRRETEQLLADRDKDLAALAEAIAADRSALARAQESFAEEENRRQDELRRQKQQIDVRREASLALVRQLMAGLERRRAAENAMEAAPSVEPGVPPADQGNVENESLRAQLRRRQLDQAEAELSEARRELERVREQLLEQRQRDREQARSDRQRMAVEHRHALNELEEKRRSVQRQSEQVDRSRTALEQLRADLSRMHREALEMRLATEELRVQLAGSAPPAAITHSLAQIRSKLADHCRAADAEMTDKKRELQSLCDQLAEQHEKLRCRKAEFEQWIAARQEEIQQQAQRLVAREQQLQEEEDRLKEAARRWQAEQIGYQQEIRRLCAQLPQPEVVTSHQP